jgi:hypothetical protein
MAKSKNLIKKPLKWFALETIGNFGYDLIGVVWRSAIMTAILTLIVRFASAIPLDVLLVIGLFIFALVFFSLQRLIDKRRGKQTALPKSETGQTETPVIESELETQIRRLQENNNALEIDIDFKRKELERYAWLHEIAKAQAKDISQYVKLERVVMSNPHSSTPSINFYFYIRNSSNYHITVDDTIGGSILFEGKSMYYQPKFFGNELKKYPPLGVGDVAIEQPLRREEADHISQFGDNAPYYFSLNELQITIKGGEATSQVEPQHLITKNIHAEWPAPNVKNLKDCIKELEAQIAAREELLTFEIDAPRSKVNVTNYNNDGFSVNLQLYISFENSDTNPLTVKSVNILLMRANEDGTESEIPPVNIIDRVDRELYEVISAGNHPLSKSEVRWEYRNLSVPLRTQTLYHSVLGHIGVSGDCRKILNENCFLRVTMDAMNQPPYSLDFNVRWQDISLGWIGITPRT